VNNIKIIKLLSWIIRNLIICKVRVYCEYNHTTFNIKTNTRNDDSNRGRLKESFNNYQLETKDSFSEPSQRRSETGY